MKLDYFKAICQMAVHGAQNLPDESAGSVPELYPSYEWLVKNNITVKKAQIIFRYGDRLYQTVKKIRNSTGRTFRAKMVVNILQKSMRRREAHEKI